jgi:GT2 family glycosyltransferase
MASLEAPSELVVVDNNSFDDTKAVIMREIRHRPERIRYAFEKRQGLSHAKNCGVMEAEGEVIAFTDDDCIVDRNWLKAIRDHFKADPGLGILGGRVELYNPEHKPITIRPFKESRVFRSIADLFYLIPGCNMAFRRAVYEQTGLFDSRLGPGSKGFSAEDSDFIYRTHKLGWPIRYEPDALVLHNHGRTTDEQVTDLARGYVYGRGAFYLKHIMHFDRVVLKTAYRELRKQVVNVCTASRKHAGGRRSHFVIKHLLGGMAYMGLRMAKNIFVH